MPHVYAAFYTLNNMEKVDTGECARLVQLYLPQLGHTSGWKPGARVIDILERGGKIAPGTAVATFGNGRYPQAGHRHAAFYEGPVTACSFDPTRKRCPVMGIILLDQWNPKPKEQPRPTIKRRSVYRQGKMRTDGSFALISNNAEAFYVIER